MASRAMDRTLLAGGVIGPIAFVVTFTVLGATRIGYDAMRQYVSLLALGEGGWAQVLNFIFAGVLVAGAGFTLARLWSTTRSGRIAARLIALVGLALAWCGVFTGDPAQGFPAGAPNGLPTEASFHAALHYVGATVLFLGLPAAMLLAGRAAGDRRWAWYGRLSAALMFGAWIATFVIPGTYGVSDAAGLLQRISFIAGMGWLGATSARELARLGNPRSIAGATTRA